MNKKNIIQKKSKQDPFYEEAQSNFITGMELEEIEKIVPVSLATLNDWKTLGHWERKKELVAEHPRLISEALRGLVKKKVKALLDKNDDISLSKIEELNKIISLIDKIQEQSWDERAAIVEVMSQFGDFARRQVGEKKELKMLARLMEGFFAEMARK